MITVIGAFLLFCLILKWQPWNSRLHLPLFVLLSPFVATVLASVCSLRVIYTVIVVFTLFNLQWVFYGRARPVLGVHNIFNKPRNSQYFVNRPNLEIPYSTTVQILRDVGCSNIGLFFTNESYEYPFWALLNQNSPASYYKIEHIKIGNSSRVLKKAFYPCAFVWFSESQEVYKVIDHRGGKYELISNLSPVMLYVRRPSKSSKKTSCDFKSPDPRQQSCYGQVVWLRKVLRPLLPGIQK
jgi:hypothetical protein